MAKRTVHDNIRTQNLTENENQINDTNSNEYNEEQKNYNEIIAKQKNAIKSMYEQLEEKENIIENLKKKYENCEEATAKLVEQTAKCKQIMDEKAKLEIVYKEKEKTIQSMCEQLKSKENAINDLEKMHKGYEIATKHKLVEQNQTNLGTLDEKEKLQKNYEKSIDQNSNLSRELQEIKTTFFGPTVTTADLSDAEKSTIKKCVEFINFHSTFPSTVTLRNKAIGKKIRSINTIETASKSVYQKCEYI